MTHADIVEFRKVKALWMLRDELRDATTQINMLANADEFTIDEYLAVRNRLVEYIHLVDTLMLTQPTQIDVLEVAKGAADEQRA
jgi:hypothetical protein